MQEPGRDNNRRLGVTSAKGRPGHILDVTYWWEATSQQEATLGRHLAALQ